MKDHPVTLVRMVVSVGPIRTQKKTERETIATDARVEEGEKVRKNERKQ